LSFEVRYTDLAGRIGKLKTPHGSLETPAFIPVIHPIRQTITPQFLKTLGFNAIITNAYITLRHYGDEARKRGIHDIIKYDGVIMTDSGGYQVLEYGSVDVEPNVIAKFENDIRSDIPVPLDKPTGYGLKYDKAKEYVKQTLKNAREALNVIGEGRKSKTIKSNIGNEYCNDDTNSDALWVGPIQGAEHSDLVKYSAEALDKMGFNLMAIGSPVELMEAYEFSQLARMIATVKQAIPAKPIHLFGAGHPITIPMAVALGCDMFDSASYILYAKDNRYMYSNGTIRLEDLSYLPCQCPICTTYSIKELLYMDKDSRILEVAKHNLYILKAEVNAVKQAIIDGRLWEYVMQKAHAHPNLMEAMELFKTFQYLDKGTRIFKEKAVFLYDPIDQYRPEAKRFRDMVSKFRPLKNKKKLILYPDSNIHPFYSTRVFLGLIKKFPDAQICTYSPFIGIIPSELSDIFPAAQNLSCKKFADYNQPKNYPSFIESLNRFVINNNFEEIIIVADSFMRQVVDEDYYNNASVIKKLNPKVFDYDYNIITKL
jgi:7-cyano-7-deazaguanine tRNA-ribosyltransferase